MDSKVLAIIPARGGSERLPGKMLKLMAGKPLIAYTIEQALEAESVDCVWVSTDCPRIAEVAIDYGAEVPFIRPTVLAGNEVMAVKSLSHGLEHFKNFQGYYPEIVVGLYPTYIFRSEGLIDEVVEAFYADDEIDTCLVGIESVNYMWYSDGERQRCLMDGVVSGFGGAIKPRFLLSLYGLVNGYRPGVLIRNRLVGADVKVIETENRFSSIEIDYLEDFEIAQWALQKSFPGTVYEKMLDCASFNL